MHQHYSAKSMRTKDTVRVHNQYREKMALTKFNPFEVQEKRTSTTLDLRAEHKI